MLTWKSLCRLQPELKQLERDALDAHDPDQPPDWEQWERLKARLGRLVGWWCSSKDSRLVEGWDAAYAHLLRCHETGRPPGARRRDTGLPSLATLEALSQPMLPLS